MPAPENDPPVHQSIDSINAGQLDNEAIAPWRSPLSRALHRNRSVPFARYLQLATLKLDGTPANRTVVFRGFLNETNCLMFISDFRSEKTAQIQHNPNAEACWYFTKTREQFRICGHMTVITAPELTAHRDDNKTHNSQLRLQTVRQQIWQNISDNARIQFAWPHPKKRRTASLQNGQDQNGQDHNGQDQSEESTAFNPSPPDNQTPPATFTLLILTPHGVDHLELRGEPQNRHLYVKNGGEVPQWNVTAVNP